MAQLAIRAFAVVVFDQNTPQATLNTTMATMQTRLVSAGFTAGQIDTYTVKDVLVGKADSTSILVDAAVARVKGVL